MSRRWGGRPGAIAFAAWLDLVLTMGCRIETSAHADGYVTVTAWSPDGRLVGHRRV